MSSSGRADVRGSAHHHRDVYQMPREYSFSCGSDNAKEKQQRREADGPSRRLSSTISLDGAVSRSRRRGEISHSGRAGGLSSVNGWHDDAICRSRSLIEACEHGSGSATGGIGSSSPRFECSSTDCSPRDLDSYQHNKANSPLFSQSRISSTSHNTLAGKGVLVRENSRCNEWDSASKGEVDYRDKIWSRSEAVKRTGTSNYDSPSSLNRESNGRRDHDAYTGSADIMGSNSYHTRSYEEWRHCTDRMQSPTLPLRSHVSSNGYLRESSARTHGFSDVLGTYTSTWHSPLSSPLNYSTDGGREEGNQSSPRKRPRLGWGQGLAKYEKKMSEGTEENSVNKGKANSSMEKPVSIHSDSHFVEENAEIAPSRSKDCSGLFVEVKEEISAYQKETFNPNDADDKMEKTETPRSIGPDVSVTSDSCRSVEVSAMHKDCENTVFSTAQCEDVLGLQGQLYSEESPTKLKTNILQRLEKLESELELTERELAKVDSQSEGNVFLENKTSEYVTGDMTISDSQHGKYSLEQKDSVPPQFGKENIEANMIDTAMQPNLDTLKTADMTLPHTDKTDSKSNVNNLSVTDTHLLASVSRKEGEGAFEKGMNISQKADGKELFQSQPLCDKERNAENIVSASLIRLDNIGVDMFVMKQWPLNTMEIAECWKNVYSENLEQAKSMTEELNILIKGSSSVKTKQAHMKRENTENKQRIKEMLREALLRQRKSLKFREQVLSLKYRAMRETWKQEKASISSGNERTEVFKKGETERRSGQFASSQRFSYRLRFVSGNSKIDAISDEVQVMQKLFAEHVGFYERPYLKMPSQILGEKEKAAQRFVSNNSLIEDPLSYEKERRLINPWTAEEKKIFLDKFILFNKNFRKIASFLEHKTVADCIEFYYRYQKSEEFDMVRNRRIDELQTKSQRDTRPSKYLVPNTGSPGNHRRDVAAISVDRLPLPVTASSYHTSLKIYPNNQNMSNHDRRSGLVDSDTQDGLQEHTGIDPSIQSLHSLAAVAEEFDSQWTDHERQVFVIALRHFGKDFKSISQRVGTKSETQCKAFFSKTRKRLKLDQVLESFQASLQECTEQEVGGDNVVFNVAETNIDTNYGDTAKTSNDTSGVNFINERNILVPSHCEVGETEDGGLKKRTATLQNHGAAEEIEEENDMNAMTLRECEDKVCIDDEKSSASATDLAVDVLGKSHICSDQDVVHSDACMLKSSPTPVVEPFCERGVGCDGAQSEIHSDEHGLNTVVSNSSGKEVMISVAEADEQHSSTPMSIPGEDDSNASLSIVEVSDRHLEDKDLLSESGTGLMHGSPNANKSLVSTSSHVSTTLTGTTSTMISSTAQPKSRGNAGVGDAKPRREATSWTHEEKERFVDIIRKFGRDWNRLQESLPTKSLTQIKTYFQNSKAKLGLAVTEASNSRIVGNRKHKIDEPDSHSSLYQLTQQKAGSVIEESVLKADHATNSSVGSMIGIPGSDVYPFALIGKGKWQVEDSNPLCGMQKLLAFQQMQSNGFNQQQSVSGSGPYSVLPPSALPVLTASGFQQSQNLTVQQPHLHPPSSKQHSVFQQVQPQQVPCVQQTHTTTLCSPLPPGVIQSKQQQKPSQVATHNPHDYQSQGLQSWVVQQQTTQSFPQSHSPSVFQEQASSQAQMIIQQNQQQNQSQNPHHIQHVLKQSIQLMQQQPSVSSLNPLSTVASLQLPACHQQTVNQHQSPAQHLINQLQLYDEQRKQYQILKSSQLSLHGQNVLGPLPDNLLLHLQQHQQNFQPDKHLKLMRMDLPISTMHESSETMHCQHSKASDIMPRKDANLEGESFTCSKSLTVPTRAGQPACKDTTDLSDTVDQNCISKSQHHESGHLQEYQVSGQPGSSHLQLRSGSFSENPQTRAGDVKLFGQILLSQSTSSVSVCASASSASSMPCLNAASSVPEGSSEPYPNDNPTLSSGVGKGPFLGQVQSIPWFANSESLVSRSSTFVGRQHNSLGKGDIDSGVQRTQVMMADVPRLVFDNRSSESTGASTSEMFDDAGDLKKMQEGENTDLGLGMTLTMDQGHIAARHAGDLNLLRPDMKYGTVRSLSVWKEREMSSVTGTFSHVPHIMTGGHLVSCDWGKSNDRQSFGAHDSNKILQMKDLGNNRSCNAGTPAQLAISNNHTADSAQSLAAGAESSQFGREKSIFVQQGIPHGPANVGLGAFNSVGGIGHGNDLNRTNMSTVSSVWSHGSMSAEGQSRKADAKGTDEVP